MLHEEKKAKRWSLEQGRRVITAWHDSGLELEEFGRRHGLSLTRLERWRSRFGPPAAPARTPSPPQFVELTLPRSMGQAAEQPVEVLCPSGYVLRIAAGFSESTLAAVLDVLEGEPC